MWVCVCMVAVVTSPWLVPFGPNRLFVSDDGKLFHGSGVGDPFGPRCSEGDVMGCGIMFPRDFSTDGGDYSSPRAWLRPLLTERPLTFPLWVFSSASDDTDDWDFEVFSKPSEVQNDLYANNEDEEGEGEDADGKKVTVRSGNLRNLPLKI